jgi:hypothetical protein
MIGNLPRWQKQLPPEECGGISAFYDLLDKVKDGKQAEIGIMRVKFGDEDDPDFFDKDEVNKMLWSE